MDGGEARVDQVGLEYKDVHRARLARFGWFEKHLCVSARTKIKSRCGAEAKRPRLHRTSHMMHTSRVRRNAVENKFNDSTQISALIATFSSVGSLRMP